MQWGGEHEDSQDAVAALASSIPMFAAMMVLVVIMLFNSLRQPLVIWLVVPLAMIGVTVEAAKSARSMSNIHHTKSAMIANSASNTIKKTKRTTLSLSFPTVATIIS